MPWRYCLRRRCIVVLSIVVSLSLLITVAMAFVGNGTRPADADPMVALKVRMQSTRKGENLFIRTSGPPSTAASAANETHATRNSSSEGTATSTETKPDTVTLATPKTVFNVASPSLPEQIEGHECDWVNVTGAPPYFLTAVFIVRIYKNDKSELTTAEVKQWLEYLRYAGVEHVYLYDTWYLPGESQEEALDIFIKEKYLTYVDWHKYNPYIREKTQLPAYQHCINKYGKESTWQAAIDIDEYPFSPSDTEPGFLYRFVKRFSEQHREVSEITMKNYLFLGEKGKEELLMERLWRHTHGPSNPLVKPIYKPPAIRSAQIHHNSLRSGCTKDAPSSDMRMNHYWGARLQNWGPDTKESLAKTEEDRGMEPIVAAFKRCEKYIRPYL